MNQQLVQQLAARLNSGTKISAIRKFRIAAIGKVEKK